MLTVSLFQTTFQLDLSPYHWMLRIICKRGPDPTPLADEVTCMTYSRSHGSVLGDSVQEVSWALQSLVALRYGSPANVKALCSPGGAPTAPPAGLWLGQNPQMPSLCLAGLTGSDWASLLQGEEIKIARPRGQGLGCGQQCVPFP